MPRIITLLLGACLVLTTAALPASERQRGPSISDEQREAFQRLAPGVEITPELIELMQEITYNPDMSVDQRLRAISRLAGLDQLPEDQRMAVTICIWDIAGRAGPVFTIAEEQRVRAAQYGLNINMVPYTNEGVMVEELLSGRCDAALMTGLRARQFNKFTGTVDAIGAVPTDDHMRTLLQVLAHPRNAGRMVHGEYVILGIFPAGAAHIFVNDREINTLGKAAGKRVVVLDYDPMQAQMVAGLGATPVQADITRAPGMFNNGVVDVLAAPLVAYEALELYRGLDPDGGIIDYPLTQLSMQLVGRRAKFPNEVAQLIREASFEAYEDIMTFLRREAKRVPDDWWINIPEADKQEYETMMEDARVELRGLGYYDGDMLQLQRRIRCRFEADRSECAEPRE